MPADYQLLMERCWASDPSDRPSADKLVSCLRVMAAERSRRLSAQLPTLPATASPAAAADAAAGRGWSSLAHTASADQATLQGLVAAHQQQQQVVRTAPTELGAGSAALQEQQRHRRGSALATVGRSSMGSSTAGLMGRPAAAAGPVGVPGSLLHQKSCPASAFEPLLRSGGAILGCSLDDGVSDSDQGVGRHGEQELEEEAEMLLQLRASSNTQSGPGSVPVLLQQPHQRTIDGLDMWPPPELDDAHMWHI